MLHKKTFSCKDAYIVKRKGTIFKEQHVCTDPLILLYVAEWSSSISLSVYFVNTVALSFTFFLLSSFDAYLIAVSYMFPVVPGVHNLYFV